MNTKLVSDPPFAYRMIFHWNYNHNSHARYAFATEIFPPVIPSTARARNNKIKGTLRTIVPTRVLSMLNFSTG